MTLFVLVVVLVSDVDLSARTFSAAATPRGVYASYGECETVAQTLTHTLTANEKPVCLSVQ